jgi:hypothetical protein
VLGHEQQDAPLRCLEDGQETPCAVKVQLTDARKLFSCEPDACGLASTSAYILHSQDEGCLRLPAQICDLLAG